MVQFFPIDGRVNLNYICIMTNDAHIYVKLGDIARISAGYPLRGSAEILEPGEVRLVQLKNTTAFGGVDWTDVISVELPSKREPQWLTNCDVLFAARGTRTLAYTVADVPAKSVCAPQFFVLSVKNSAQVSPQFLAWQINQKPAQEYLQKNATGSHIQNIRRGVLEELTIAVPSQERQRMVVDFWQAAQRERAVLNRLIETRNAQLDALAAGLAPQSLEA
jgi:hypothetical protein